MESYKDKTIKRLADQIEIMWAGFEANKSYDEMYEILFGEEEEWIVLKEEDSRVRRVLNIVVEADQLTMVVWMAVWRADQLTSN